MGESRAVQEVRKDYRVPDTIGLRVDAREVLAWVPGAEMAVREVAAHPDDLEVSRAHGGRVPLRRLGDEGGTLLVRELRKGGLLRRVRGRRMRGRWRPLDELVLLRSLGAAGVPVPEAVGCVILRAPTGWRGFLISRLVEESLDLEAWLHGVPGPPGLDPRHVLAEAGRTVRRLHDAGVPHPDLHPKNLLLTSDGSVLVLDLDKAEPAAGRLDDRVRLKNLVRLGRSIEKHRLKGLRTGRREALRFLEGYAGSPEAARHWLDTIRAHLQRGLGARTLWWRLAGEARPWRSSSAGDA